MFCFVFLTKILKKGNGNPYLRLNHVFWKGLNFRNYLKVNKIGSQKEYYS